jgi:hypothetical protein
MLDLCKESPGKGFEGHFMGLSQHLNAKLTLNLRFAIGGSRLGKKKAPTGAFFFPFEAGF